MSNTPTTTPEILAPWKTLDTATPQEGTQCIVALTLIDFNDKSKNMSAMATWHKPHFHTTVGQYANVLYYIPTDELDYHDVSDTSVQPPENTECVVEMEIYTEDGEIALGTYLAKYKDGQWRNTITTLPKVKRWANIPTLPTTPIF